MRKCLRPVAKDESPPLRDRRTLVRGAARAVPSRRRIPPTIAAPIDPMPASELRQETPDVLGKCRDSH